MHLKAATDFGLGIISLITGGRLSMQCSNWSSFPFTNVSISAGKLEYDECP